MSEADLSGDSEFHSTNLSNANLSNANLEAAHLNYADLSGTCLVETNLKYASISDTSICSSNLTRANLHKADLSYTNLQGSNLTETAYEVHDLSKYFRKPEDIAVYEETLIDSKIYLISEGEKRVFNGVDIYVIGKTPTGNFAGYYSQPAWT